MVSKIEILLTATVLLAIGGGFLLNSSGLEKNNISTSSSSKKIVEIKDGVVRDVNSSSLKNLYKSRYSYMIDKVWYFENFFLKTPDIKSLSSKKAKKDEKRDYLEGDVILERLDNSKFFADKIIYDESMKILHSIGAFRAEKGSNRVRGINLFYDLRNKITKAEDIFAHYEMEKTKSIK